MCSKLSTVRAGKSGCLCSSPQKTTSCLSVAKNWASRPEEPLLSSAEVYHTILIFGVSLVKPQVLRVSALPGCRELVCSQGLHAQQLRRAQANGQLCQYEWNMEHGKKTHTQQTTLVPLPGPDGRVNSVISLTKDISSWGTAPLSRALHDKGPAHTFAQILLSARENEKQKVAKALHDEIGSASVMLSALICAVKQSISHKTPTQALADVDRLRQQIQDSMERMHAIVVNLCPPSLDTDGALRGSIEELLSNVCRLGRLKYQFVCKPRLNEKGISASVKILLYRTVQEALNNVLKHAHATQVTVKFERRKPSSLVLVVQDDGVGFEREKRLSIKHIGLLSMRDSIRAVGGTLSIVTSPGKGTCIRAVCPCFVYEENYEDKDCISR